MTRAISSAFCPTACAGSMEASQGVPPPADGEASRWNLEYSSYFWNGHYDPWLAGMLFVAGDGAWSWPSISARAATSASGHRLLMAGLRLGLLVLLLAGRSCRSCASGTSVRAGRTWRSFSTIRRA